MSSARPKQRPAPRVATAVAAEALETWAVPTAAGVLAVLAALAAAFELVATPVGLAVTVFALLVLVAERSLHATAAAESPGIPVVVAIGLAWIVLCYFPFHVLFFPGGPLHAPVTLRASDKSLPVPIPASGRSNVDVMLEGELPPNPSGGTAIPVQYTITVEDAAKVQQVLTGRFDESLRTQRLGRRGTATVVESHHAERRLVANAAQGDLSITGVALEPAEGAAVTVTAYAHHLPSVPILVVLGVGLLAAAAAFDARVVPASEGTLTLATAGALGAAVALWTSNTVHPTVSSLIGSMIFGGPLGLGVGALAWAIARRTLVQPGR